MEVAENRKKLIEKVKKNFEKIFNSVSSEKKDIIKKLIERASFLLVMIHDMETELMQCESYTTTTINASQTFIKSNPLLKDYRDTVKSFQTVLKQLCDLTKDGKNPVKPDALEEFLNG